MVDKTKFSEHKPIYRKTLQQKEQKMYEIIKNLNKTDKRKMLGFTRKSLHRQRRIARDQYEREQDASKPKSS